MREKCESLTVDLAFMRINPSAFALFDTRG